MSMTITGIGGFLVIFTYSQKQSNLGVLCDCYLHKYSRVGVPCLTARSAEEISRRQCCWLSWWLVVVGHIHSRSRAFQCGSALIDLKICRIYQRTTKSITIIVIGVTLVILTYSHKQLNVDLLYLTVRSGEHISRRQYWWLSQVMVVF